MENPTPEQNEYAQEVVRNILDRFSEAGEVNPYGARLILEWALKELVLEAEVLDESS